MAGNVFNRAGSRWYGFAVEKGKKSRLDREHMSTFLLAFDVNASDVGSMLEVWVAGVLVEAGGGSLLEVDHAAIEVFAVASGNQGLPGTGHLTPSPTGDGSSGGDGLFV